MKGRKPEIPIDNKAVSTILKPPAWLPKDAKNEWRRVMPDLTKRRILTDADLGSLENYCIATGQIREMQRLIDKEGHIVQTDRGPRVNPAVRVQNDAMTRSRQLAAELGLTPVARARPNVRIDEDNDDSTSDLGV